METTTEFRAMSDAALADFLGLDDEEPETDFACCPHCDAILHGPTSYCGCAGCDACTRARAWAARLAAAWAEWHRRHPPVQSIPVPAFADNEPF